MISPKEPPGTDDAGDEPDDASLMGRLAGEDMNALAVLVERHQQRVRRIAYRFCGRWDQADDIAQETFLRMYRAAGSYKPSAAFSTWLYRIVVNLCLDRAKRPRLAALPDEPPPGKAPAADEAMVRDECVEAVRRAIASLPERQRIVLLLHRFEHLDHAQIAQSTGWSQSAIESLLVRAYAQLRQRLQVWARE